MWRTSSTRGTCWCRVSRIPAWSSWPVTERDSSWSTHSSCTRRRLSLKSRAVGPETVRHVAQELAGQDIHVESRGERLAHRQERLRLVELQLRLSRQIHVLHAEADLGGHALDEPHLRLPELASGLPPDQED